MGAIIKFIAGNWELIAIVLDVLMGALPDRYCKYPGLLLTVGNRLYFNGKEVDDVDLAKLTKGVKIKSYEDGYSRICVIALLCCFVLVGCKLMQHRPSICDTDLCAESRICSEMAEAGLVPEDVDLILASVNTALMARYPGAQEVLSIAADYGQHLLTLPTTYQEFQKKFREYIPDRYRPLLRYAEMYSRYISMDSLISGCDRQILHDRLDNFRIVVEGTVAGPELRM